MCTQEQFAAIWQEMKLWHNFHNNPAWVVALNNNYALSVTRPDPSQISEGTVANRYDVGGVILESVSYQSSFKISLTS